MAIAALGQNFIEIHDMPMCCGTLCVILITAYLTRSYLWMFLHVHWTFTSETRSKCLLPPCSVFGQLVVAATPKEVYEVRGLCVDCLCTVIDWERRYLHASTSTSLPHFSYMHGAFSLFQSGNLIMHDYVPYKSRPYVKFGSKYWHWPIEWSENEANHYKIPFQRLP